MFKWGWNQREKISSQDEQANERITGEYKICYVNDNDELLLCKNNIWKLRTGNKNKDNSLLQKTSVTVFK